MAQSDNHPDPNSRKGQQHRQELAPHQSTVPIGQDAVRNFAALNTDTHPFPPCSAWLSAKTLGMHSTVDDHCQWSPPTLLPASQEKSRLTEQWSLRSIWQLYSTMWTINNCSIVSPTPTYQQQPVAGSTTICRTYEPNLPAAIRRWLYNYLQNIRAKLTSSNPSLALQLSAEHTSQTYQQQSVAGSTTICRTYEPNLPAAIRRWLYNYLQNIRAKLTSSNPSLALQLSAEHTSQTYQQQSVAGSTTICRTYEPNLPAAIRRWLYNYLQNIRAKLTSSNPSLALQLSAQHTSQTYQQQSVAGSTTICRTYEPNLPAAIRRWLYNYLQNIRAKLTSSNPSLALQLSAEHTSQTYQQHSVAGSTTICRTYKPNFIFGKKNLKAEWWKQEWYKEKFCLQRSSITVWPTFQHHLRTSSWSSTTMTLPSTHPDLWWLT